MQQEASILNRYYDIPYLRNGRSFDGCDCFGLLWLWFLNERGICLPIYECQSPDDQRVGQASGFIEGLYRHFKHAALANPQRHDVLYLSHNGNAHCGVILDKRKFIHSLSKIGVAVSNIPSWKPRIEGIYRYVD